MNKLQNKMVVFKTNACKYITSTTDDSTKVFNQLLIEEFPSIDELAYLKNDFELSKQIKSDSVLTSIGLMETDDGIVVVKEFFEGIPLGRYIENMPFSVPKFVHLAIKLTQHLKDLHKHNIIVKEFIIENILIHPETQELKICCLGSSSNLTRERLEYGMEFNYFGSLWHLAPEQTGRIGRTLDFRADFYALGILLYQILCKRRPFTYTDSLELIHAHIAKQPLPPVSIVPGIPKPINDIVLKLMSKNAEDRYQSEEGILADLDELLDIWAKDGEVNDFELGKNDYSSAFNISEKLYGREEEEKQILAKWNEVLEGKPRTFMVAGYSGIGKTRLIDEIRKSVFEANATYISGKFDQLKKDLPYGGFVQAMNNLIQITLNEGEEKQEIWKNRINKLDESGLTSLCNLMPKLKLLLSEDRQKLIDIAALDSAQNATEAFKELIKVFCQKSSPLTIFIDDLQWADSESIELLGLLAESKIKHLFVIGAYRDNEVDDAHPLTMTLNEIKSQAPDHLHGLTLTDLLPKDINQMLADSLNLSPKLTRDLCDVIYSKTRGNPYFILQFIAKLVSEKLISFDHDLKKWIWKLEKIKDLEISEYVVDLILKKLEKIPIAAQNLIKYAACIGNRFDFDTLGIVSGINEKEINDSLWLLVQNELINPIGQWQRHSTSFLEKFDEDEQSDFVFKFLHDKIQQAAYSLIPKEKKENTHYKIGINLLDKLSAKELDEQVFDVTNHLNIGRQAIDESMDMDRIAELNLKAAKRALDNNVIRTAHNYFKTGMDIIEEDQDSPYFKELLIGQSECLYLVGEWKESEELFDKAVANADNNLKRADILCRKMALYENTQRHQLAIDTARQGLALLGMKLPMKTSNLHVMQELLKVKYSLRNKTTKTLLHKELMESPEKILMMKILMNLWGPAYLLQKQELLAFKILRMVNLSIKYGNSIESALAYAFYGYVISAQLKDYITGCEYAELGLKLNNKFNDKTLRSKVIVIAEGCVLHWGKPAHEGHKKMREAFHVGVESNDIIYAGYAASFMNRSNMWSGMPLDTMRQRMTGFFQFVYKIKSEISIHQMLPWARLVFDLSNTPKTEDIFAKLADEGDHLDCIHQMNDELNLQLPLANYYTSKLLYHMIMDEDEIALTYGYKADPLMASVMGLTEWSGHLYFKTLALAFKKDRGQTSRKENSFLKKHIKLIERWGSNAPDNYGAMAHLLKAIDVQSKKDVDHTISHFRLAIQAATHSKQLYMLGMVFEHLGKFNFLVGQTQEGNRHIHQAMVNYHNWGASVKVKQLKNKYPFLNKSSKSGHSGVIDIHSSDMDLKSILQAAQTLSGEVVLDKVLEKLMLILIKNAGAQNAYLMQLKEGKPVIQARSIMLNDNVCEMTEHPIHDFDEISQNMVEHVINSKNIVIADGVNEIEEFIIEDRFKNIKTISILCMPILSQGEISAILYLDNHLSSSVFTTDRSELLQLLSGQIAISLENATLYTDLENRVKERTKTIKEQNLEIQKSKLQSDQLLLNILPTEIADELKNTGKCKPRKYESVTIMFTDFEKFTQMSEELEPEEIVAIVDHSYKAFDKIAQKYGIEKIKTMGDAYMCVSGLPMYVEDHAVNAVLAAREIRDFIAEYNAEREAAKLPYCRIRIGLHTGAVVAGVVGHIKFAFDIWGDAVNTASRMQSAGNPGKINISKDTYELIKHRFECEYRGAIDVKNKGKVEMYFVQDEDA